MATQEVCIHCGNSIEALEASGKKVCPVCLGDSFESIEQPKVIKCYYCKKTWTIDAILKQWKNIPFYNKVTNTFYDGCRGWD